MYIVSLSVLIFYFIRGSTGRSHPLYVQERFPTTHAVHNVIC